MKLLSTNGRLTLILLTRKRTERHQVRLFKKAKRLRRKNRFKFIEAPRVFHVTRDSKIRVEMLAFLDELRNMCASRHNVLIDFTRTQQMMTCGTLLFVAELRNIINSCQGNIVIRCKPSQNSKVMQVLKQVGVLDLLKFREHVKPIDDDVVNWRFTKGRRVLGKEYEAILSHLDDTLDKDIQSDLYVGLTEAMANTQHHAYIDKRKQGEVASDVESWWAFSQVRDGLLCVVFCDLGVGIPGSLPKKQPEWYDIIERMFDGAVPDHKVIEETIKLSESRTGSSNRGKGLNQFVNAVKGVEGGYLAILSNRGGYVLDNQGPRSTPYTNSLGGTLIEWSIPLNARRQVAS